jgi:hypothetical protein
MSTSRPERLEGAAIRLLWEAVAEAVVVIDVLQGLSTGVRRDLLLLSLLGVRQLVLAVNKIDLDDRSQAAFGRIDDEYRMFSARLKLPPAPCVPVSGEFIEIFVDAPLAVAEQRDPKGLYKKARRGALKNFTGIDSPYEGPDNPELRIDTTVASPEEAAVAIVAYLQERGVLA